MRLLFLCGSLEAGCDGVGDYVRQLAATAAARGHTCAIVALRDFHAPTVEDGLLESGGGPRIAFLRLPASLGLRTIAPAATAFRRRFAPDWISLQLVAYGLHPRGFLFSATPILHGIVGETPVHLMLHELWLGNDAAPCWRHRVTGALQRASLRKLLATLRPRYVATSNPVYAALLRTIAVHADLLPLFGNIPLARAPLPAALDEAGVTPTRRDDKWLGLFFGGLYPQWTPEPFFTLLAAAARRAGRRVVLLHAGRAGAEGEAIWARLARDYGSRFLFLALGSQPAPVLAALLAEADFGVAASPWSLIGKSGSVAAMLDHGLPVIVTRDDFRPRVGTDVPPSTDPLLHRCDRTLADKLVAGLPRRAPRASVDQVADTFLRRLEENQAAMLEPVR